MRRLRFFWSCLLGCWLSASNGYSQFESYKDHYVNNKGVSIHYVSKGQGPVIVFLHGFPDFWFTWKHQMDDLASDHTVIGIDLRAYNYSDGPDELEAYQMGTLMSDVVAVMDDLSADPVTLIGNDWGGAIAWLVATYHPTRVKALVACNIPHPQSLRQHLDRHPSVADYTSKMTGGEAATYWNVEKLMEGSGAYHTEHIDAYRQAFLRSKIEGILNYYKASYPKPSPSSGQATTVKKVECPVLIIHGLEDPAFPPGTLNDHWEWVNNSLSLHTIKSAGHFVQREEPEIVLRHIREWLARLK